MTKILSGGLSDIAHCWHAVPFAKLVGQWATDGQVEFDEVSMEHLVSLLAIAQTIGSVAQMLKNTIRADAKS
jgi:hypothetical protein